MAPKHPTDDSTMAKSETYARAGHLNDSALSLTSVQTPATGRTEHPYRVLDRRRAPREQQQSGWRVIERHDDHAPGLFGGHATDQDAAGQCSSSL